MKLQLQFGDSFEGTVITEQCLSIRAVLSILLVKAMFLPHMSVEKLVPCGGEVTSITIKALLFMQRVDMTCQVWLVVTAILTVRALVDILAWVILLEVLESKFVSSEHGVTLSTFDAIGTPFSNFFIVSFFENLFMDLFGNFFMLFMRFS